MTTIKRHSPKRRRFLGATAAAGALGSMPLALATTDQQVRRKRDLALVNGRIHTLDAHDTVVDSLLIRDGKFARVGGIRHVGDDVEVINLRGRTVIPGIIDNHVHFIRIGNAAGHDERRLETAFSVAAAQAVIRARAAMVPEGEFVTALAGIVRRQFAEGRFPNLAELDDAAPRHPVLISEGGVGQANTLGRDRLRALGVAVNDDGSMPNHAPAYTALAAFLTNEARKRQLLYAAKYALEIGLTTVMDMHGSTGGAGFLNRVSGHDFYLEMVREGTLKVRTRVFFPEQTDLTLLQAILDNRWREFGADLHKTVGVGEWAPRGVSYQESLRRIAQRGWLYHQHLISTNEIQAHLNAFATYRSENPSLPTPAELHWNLGHVGDITEAQVRQANDLGVGLCPHPWRYLSSNSGGPNSRMILDVATVPVGSGLDGARVAPLNPWAGIYFQTTGRNSGGALVAESERVTRTESLRMWCGPQQGWFTKEDKVLGGIAPGRFADLAVLAADVFDTRAVPDDRLRNMTSVLTVVGGEIVHDTGALRSERRDDDGDDQSVLAGTVVD
jgi:predicted amidohydrolase YtcJ